MPRFAPEHTKLQSDLARTLIELALTSGDNSPLLVKFYSSEILELLIDLITRENNTYGFRAGMAVLSQLLRVLGSQIHDENGFDRVKREL
jgi:hypothetical protein